MLFYNIENTKQKIKNKNKTKEQKEKTGNKF